MARRRIRPITLLPDAKDRLIVKLRHENDILKAKIAKHDEIVRGYQQQLQLTIQLLKHEREERERPSHRDSDGIMRYSTPTGRTPSSLGGNDFRGLKKRVSFAR